MNKHILNNQLVLRIAFALLLSAGVGYAIACSAIVDTDKSKLTETGGTGSIGMTGAGSGSGTGTGSGSGSNECVGSCDDGVACTDDSCVNGVCVPTANDALCNPGEGCDVTQGCIAATQCTEQSSCDNSLVCDGVESCDPNSSSANSFGCVSGTPLACNDSPNCSASCAEPSGCVYTTNDDDNDGYKSETGGADPSQCACTTDCDCDDGNADIHPGRDELCDATNWDCKGDSTNSGNCRGQECSNEEDVSFSGDTAVLSGDLQYYEADHSVSCDTRGGGTDAVYKMVLDSSSQLKIDATGSEVDIVIGMTTSGGFCNSWASCFDNASGGNECIDFSGATQSAGTYYLIIKGYNPATISGKYQLTITRNPSTDCDGDPL